MEKERQSKTEANEWLAINKLYSAHSRAAGDNVIIERAVKYRWLGENEEKTGRTKRAVARVVLQFRI